MCWASSEGKSTSLGHVAWGGVSAQAPPSASPLLLPSLVAPLPFPLSLYFYSLNSAESPAFYSNDSPPTHTHTHTHTHKHTHLHTPTHTHPYTHIPTHRHLHTHTYLYTHTHAHTRTCTHTHSCLEKHNLGVSGSGVSTDLDQMHTQPPQQPSVIPFWLFPSEEELGGGGCMRNACHRDVIPKVRGNHLWSFMKTANPQVSP